MKVILKINNMMLPREKCENIRDTVVNDLNELGVAVVPDFVEVYILDDNTEVAKSDIEMRVKFFNEIIKIWNDCHTAEEFKYLFGQTLLRCIDDK